MRNLSKKSFLLFLFACPFFCLAQSPSDQLIISGKVEKEQVFTIADLMRLPMQNIGDVLITNHLGEPRGTTKNMRGVLLKDVFAQISIQAESPKVLSEFYLVMIASDGYKVVFSWNELFNSPTGEKAYLVLEKEGKAGMEMPERILLICPSDYKTGRRYVKGLSRIVVARAE